MIVIIIIITLKKGLTFHVKLNIMAHQTHICKDILKGKKRERKKERKLLYKMNRWLKAQ